MDSNGKGVVATPSGTTSRPPTKHKRRFCKVEGCERIVKSQGLCQRHGAKPCKCRVPGCGKQAQGNFNGMCKAHFRQLPPGEMMMEGSTTTAAASSSPTTSPKRKPMVCKTIVPDSPSLAGMPLVAAPGCELQGSNLEAQKATTAGERKKGKGTKATASTLTSTATLTTTATASLQVLSPKEGTTFDKTIPASIAWDPQSGAPMPLIALLKSGYDDQKGFGWHRTEERISRSLVAASTHSPLEPWEMELLFVEILILTGQPQICFRYLAHAWGQPTGFHLSVGRSVCGSQEVNEVSEEESEMGSTQAGEPPVQPENATSNNNVIHDTRHDLRRENNCATKNSEGQRSPLDTLIALLSTNE